MTDVDRSSPEHVSPAPHIRPKDYSIAYEFHYGHWKTTHLKDETASHRSSMMPENIESFDRMLHMSYNEQSVESCSPRHKFSVNESYLQKQI